MSLTSAVGLLGVFLVDFLDMFFLSLLGQSELAAAVGYAGTVTFFTVSICIGLSIATGIVLARLIGQNKHNQAKVEFVGSTLLTLLIACIVSAAMFPFLREITILLGASGKTLGYAVDYLTIIVPSLPFLALAMCFSSALRSLGAAKSAMLTILAGSFVNGVLDPLLIFWMDWGVEGAAIASALARISMCLLSAGILMYKYHFFTPINLSSLPKSAKIIAPLALPAVLTNLATPVANAYIISVMSQFGDSAVAGFAIIGRVIPVAFAVVFGLSGAIGPIIGQNLGAKLYHRINNTVNFSYLFVSLYVGVVWILLLLLSDALTLLFNASEEAESLLVFFCNYISISFLFVGITFVSNAVFNNLGKPHYSTIMNWAKATIGTIPFVYIGGMHLHAEGVLIGQAIGNIIFGIIAFIAVHIYLEKYQQ